MRDDVRRALAIDASSTVEDRTIDITTTGRRTGQPRRIEIVFYRLGDDIYLSGIPSQKPRDWLVNLGAQPEFVVHLKHDVVADLPATATVVTGPVERRRLTPIPHVFTQVRGRVVVITSDGGEESIDALAMKYIGKPYAWYGGRKQTRLVVGIEADHITSVP